MLLLPKDGNYININEKTSRDLRQEECVEKWIKNRCKGTIIAATGFGKTRVDLMCIKRFLTKNPESTVLVVVPTQTLKDQWFGLLITNGIPQVAVEVINTVVKKGNTERYEYDLLVVDNILLT